jgi:hypothetical protein
MFITKKYIYTSDNKKKKNEIEIEGIKLNPFLFDFLDAKKYYKDAYFYDYDFSFLGDYLYFDENCVNINGKVFEHNLLLPEKRKKLFNDLEPLKGFFKKHLKEGMKVISFENLEELNIKTITPFEALSLKEKLDKIFLKNRGNWVEIESLNNQFVYGKKLSLKIDDVVKEYNGVDGIVKLKIKRKNNILILNFGKKEIKIDLLNL